MSDMNDAPAKKAVEGENRSNPTKGMVPFWVEIG